MPHREFLRGFGRLFVGLGLTFATLLSSTAQAQTAVAAAPEKVVFLVTDVFVGDGVPLSKDDAREVLSTRFGRLKDKLEVRSVAEAKASIDAAALAQLTGSGSDEDLARVEQYLQVDRMVLGRVTQVGGVTDLQVKVFNVKEGVTEVSFARRLGKNAERSMVLTLLDGLADSLLAWTLEHYTDGAMSAEANKYAQKKVKAPPPPPPPPPPSSPWSGLGIAGGVGAGAGVGVAAVGLVNALTTDAGADSGGFSTQNLALIGVGAGVAVVGAAIVVVDSFE